VAGAAGEQLFEACDVSGLRSSDEGVEETLLLGGTDRPAMFAGQRRRARVTSCRALWRRARREAGSA
jgi:hypothetical protein